jgi:hypothetical protein
MGWRDIDTAIKSDAGAEAMRLQKAQLRSTNIGRHSNLLWDILLSSLEENAKGLTQKLHQCDALNRVDEISLVERDDSFYSFQNRTFPMIHIDVRYKHGESIHVSGKKFISALSEEAIRPIIFTFDTDMRYEVCLSLIGGQMFSPSQAADFITDIAAESFRIAALR